MGKEQDSKSVDKKDSTDSSTSKLRRKDSRDKSVTETKDERKSKRGDSLSDVPTLKRRSSIKRKDSIDKSISESEKKKDDPLYVAKNNLETQESAVNEPQNIPNEVPDVKSPDSSKSEKLRKVKQEKS